MPPLILNIMFTSVHCRLFCCPPSQGIPSICLIYLVHLIGFISFEDLYTFASSCPFTKLSPLQIPVLLLHLQQAFHLRIYVMYIYVYGLDVQLLQRKRYSETTYPCTYIFTYTFTHVWVNIFQYEFYSLGRKDM